MMAAILDQTQDLAGRELHRMQQLLPLPDFVKEASHDQICGDPQVLPRHIYADQVKRLYPCHTAAATYISTAYFLEKQAHVPPCDRSLIEQHLRKSAEYFRITGSIAALREKIAALSHDSEASLPDEAFAMVAESEGQPKRRQLPLRNAGEVKAAAAWLEKYRDEFLYPDRRKIADRIFEKAGEFGATLGDHSEFIEKLAGFGTCDAETIAVELEKRAQLIWRKDAEAATEIRNLAAIVRSSPIESRQPHQLEKMATAIDQLDFNYGLNKLYADGLDRPEDALFQITEKVATSFISDHIETTTGSVYELSKLAELSPTAVRNWMGDDFTEAVTGGDGLMLDLEKLATILPTLPRDDAGMFDRMVGSLGVSPVGTVPTGGHQLSQDRLFELAAQRQPVAVG